MPKYRRWNPLAWVRSLRWWLITYGSWRPFKQWYLFWLRTPSLSLVVFAAGVFCGAYYVWYYVPCP